VSPQCSSGGQLPGKNAPAQWAGQEGHQGKDRGNKCSPSLKLAMSVRCACVDCTSISIYIYMQSMYVYVCGWEGGTLVGSFFAPSACCVSNRCLAITNPILFSGLPQSNRRSESLTAPPPTATLFVCYVRCSGAMVLQTAPDVGTGTGEGATCVSLRTSSESYS